MARAEGEKDFDTVELEVAGVELVNIAIAIVTVAVQAEIRRKNKEQRQAENDCVDAS